MNEQTEQAWKILLKAQELEINIEKETEELRKTTGKKSVLDITPGEIISWAAALGHPKLNLFLKELNIPIWEEQIKDNKVVHIEAYLHNNDSAYMYDLAAKLGKDEDKEFMGNFRYALGEVKLTLAVQPDGTAKIVKLDDRIIYEE